MPERMGDPLENWRSDQPADWLARLIKAAPAFGVTRLAQVTGLDRLGIPVWQAVRPMGASLSVHQGKGWSDAQAKIGALLEAFEFSAQERFARIDLTAPHRDLPEPARIPDIGDFAANRAKPPPKDQALPWVLARGVLGQDFYAPYASLRYDQIEALPGGFRRCTSGVASGFSEATAQVSAICELIERDASQRFEASGGAEQSRRRLAIAHLPKPLRDQAMRLERLDLILSFWDLTTRLGVPVIRCVIVDLGADGLGQIAPCEGFGCHPLAEVAISQALLEAVQSRATEIAGAREDLPDIAHSALKAAAHNQAFLLMAEGAKAHGQPPASIAPVGASAEELREGLLNRLFGCGLTQVGWVDLTPADHPGVVGKAFIPGLAIEQRCGRAPL
jgi:ribosomal protein S12 methylthiotransferase accessory factor